MLKKNDIVVTPKGLVAQVEGFHKDGASNFALLRVYRSQKRLAVPVTSLRKHSFFA